MPLTALTTLIGSLVMIGSWLFIGQRIRHSQAGVPSQVRLLHQFFMYVGIFFLFMFSPHVLLSSDPSQFPLYMAWGYVIGHVFLYLAFINVLRLMFSLAPRLVSKVNYAVAASGIAGVALTILNLITMVYGQQPTYDYERSVTLFNAAPVVGVGIAVFAAVTMLPTAVLMIINGVHNKSARVRSFLLGGGLFILMTAGPLHDIATTWQLYMVADIVSMLGLVVIAFGVLYRLEERIGVAKPLQPTKALQ